MKKTLLAFLLVSSSLLGAPITINDPNDYFILKRFFKSMVEEEVFGYVLEGDKPLSALNIYPLNSLLHPNARFFEWTVLAQEAIEVWNRLAPKQRDYVFKAVKAFSHQFSGYYHELLFANRTNIEDVLNRNLDLFRFHLGPTVDAPSLTKLIVDSSNALDSIIQSNNTLMGILLGYGTYNSLMGGRLEKVLGAHNNLDCPPFLGVHTQFRYDKSQSPFFLAYTGSESTPTNIAEKLSLQPGIGCKSLKEEIAKITSLMEKIPTSLLKENPAFIFGAYQDKTNQSFFEQIGETQKRIQHLLSRTDFLEYILEKITGESPIINCELQTSPLPIRNHPEKAIAHQIWQMAQSLDKEAIPEFIEKFCNHSTHKRGNPECSIISGVLSGLLQAKANLQIAEEQLSTWTKNETVKEIVPKCLYYETVISSDTDPIVFSTDLLLSYVIEDSLGQTLSAQHKCWVDLTQTFPSFAHGIKGMKKGETRYIYIHPAYGYGVFTSLSPCVALKVKVTLHDVNENIQKELLPLLPINLDWVRDPDVFNQICDSTYENARYLGKLWGEWLSSSKEIDFIKVCNLLKEFSNSNESPKLEPEDAHISNRVFWNLINSSRFSKKFSDSELG